MERATRRWTGILRQRSPVISRHLKLSRVPLCLPITLSSLEHKTSHKCPLRSLHLDIRPTEKIKHCGDGADEQSPQRREDTASNAERFSGLLTSLLKFCSSSLVSLHLGYEDFTEAVISGGSPVFPCLRSFRCRWTALEPGTWSAILEAPLRELKIGHCSRPPVLINLAAKHLPHLKAFSNFSISESEEAKLLSGFLLGNSHIEKILLGSTPDAILDDDIIPALGNGTSLT